MTTRILCSSNPWTPDLLEHVGPESKFYGSVQKPEGPEPTAYSPVFVQKDRWGSIWVWLAVAGGMYVTYRMLK